MTTDEVEAGLKNGSEHPAALKEQTSGIDLTADAGAAHDGGAQVHILGEQISFKTWKA